MDVLVHLKKQALPIAHKNAFNAYTKGRLYCVYYSDVLVYKYPIRDIFKIVETAKVKED